MENIFSRRLDFNLQTNQVIVAKGFRLKDQICTHQEFLLPAD